jgi:hypothetical protein
MAREQDGGFRPAEPDCASLGRNGEMNQQLNRVEFEQIIDSLCATRHPLEIKLAKVRTQRGGLDWRRRNNSGENTKACTCSTAWAQSQGVHGRERRNFAGG